MRLPKTTIENTKITRVALKTPKTTRLVPLKKPKTTSENTRILSAISHCVNLNAEDKVRAVVNRNYTYHHAEKYSLPTKLFVTASMNLNETMKYTIFTCLYSLYLLQLSFSN